MAEESFGEGGVEFGGADARGVAGAEDEIAMGGGEFAAEFEQGEQVASDRPGLAFGAVSVAGGVEDDGVVGVVASDFAFAEFECVFDDPADGCVGEARELGVFAGAVDHAFGGVDVGDFGTGGGGGEGAGAGVGEEVEDF